MHKLADASKAPRRVQKSFWILLFIAFASFVLVGCSGSSSTEKAPAEGKGGGKGGRGGRRGGGGDVPVTVATVSQRSVPVELQVIGNVEAYATISVRAQVGGALTDVFFHEGDFVKKGDLLFRIDQRPFRATLDQMTANMARDKATLAQAQAKLAQDTATQKYQRAQADRYAQLFKSGVISKDQSEQLAANADAITQAVAADKATIESATAAIGASTAAVENAKVQLGYTEIRSPIDGRTGNLAVKAGNLVIPNNQELMTINQIEPIYVTFAVPEAQLPSIKRYMAAGPMAVRARPQDNAGATEETGRLTFVDNAVDTTTGTIKLKGTFQNSSRTLWPGQFVRVTVRMTTQADAMVVPMQAVQTGQDGSYVYVVKADRTVESRPVVPGTQVGEDVVLDKGVTPGETVVTEGQLRLVPGSRVILRDAGGRGGRGAQKATGGDSAPAGRGEGGGREGRGRRGGGTDGGGPSAEGRGLRRPQGQ